jgi:hypothetical protein
VRLPLMYAAIVAVLLGYRIFVALRKRAPAAARATQPTSAG